MAGPSKALKPDPALVKYANLYVKRHEYFRWTPRTAYLSLLYVVAIPGSLYWLSTRTEGKYVFRGKRRGDTLYEF